MAGCLIASVAEKREALLPGTSGIRGSGDPGIQGSRDPDNMALMQYSEKLRCVLTEAACLLSDVDLSIWVANCGRNVSYHSGPAALLMRLRVITSAEDGDIHIGKSKYCTLADARDKSVELIGEIVKASLALKPIYPPRIVDAEDWADRIQRGLVALQAVRAPGLRVPTDVGRAGYLTKWTLRTLFYVSMKVR